MKRILSKLNLPCRTFVDKRKAGDVHFVGICGVGMAGLAFLLKKKGYRVSGCDLSTGTMAGWLRKHGIPVEEGHSPAHIHKETGWIIATPAVGLDHPELAMARKRKIPVSWRGEVLAHLVNHSKSVAVAGTHGKTSTATFIAQCLHAAGSDVAWCIGGTSAPLQGVAGGGFIADSCLVVEADESDGTLAHYAPGIAVVTNIELDHMEHFGNARKLDTCFRSFVHRAGKRVIYCHDDARATRVCRSIKGAVSYGFGKGSGFRACVVRLHADSSEFTVCRGDRRLGRLRIPVPGKHNILNVLAVVAVGMELGFSFAQLARLLRGIRLPARRMEAIPYRKGIQVFSDYGHHPSEIRAVMNAVSSMRAKRIMAVFQPHRYSRTRLLGAQFPAAFRGVDKLVLVPVYAASERPMPGGKIHDLYEHFRKQGDAGPRETILADSLEQAWSYLRKEVRRGDMLLIVGAGDVEQIAKWAARDGRKRLMDQKVRPPRILSGYWEANASLGKRTTLGTGGTCDWLAHIGSVQDLRKILKWCRCNKIPFRVLGAGSNLAVSDLGVRGVTARLDRGVFVEVNIKKGVLTAGAGVPLARLIGETLGNGYGGLEFLAGIPGTVGGAVRMNAGAWGSDVSQHIIEIRCLNSDGSTVIVPASRLKAGYRRCGAMDGRTLLSARFRLDPGRGKKAMNIMIDYRGRKEWMLKLHTAGSVFKNPRAGYAGQIIESAGLKGRHVGGAEVSYRHANVIGMKHGATTSDFLSLMRIVRDVVEAETGVCLEPEVISIG